MARSRPSSSTARLGTALGLSAACLAPLLLVVGAAEASTSTETYDISGTLSIGPPPAITLPGGSSITFTLDDETGAISNGQTSIPTFDRGAVSGPQALITLSDAAPATGSLDLQTGAANITLTLSVSISVPALSATCGLAGTVTVSLSTANVGGSALTGEPPTGILTATGVSVPGVGASAGCDQLVADAINDLIDLPTADTAFTLSVGRTSSVTTTTSTTTTSTTTTTTTTTTSPTTSTSVEESTTSSSITPSSSSTAAPPTAAPTTAPALPATGNSSPGMLTALAALLVLVGVVAMRFVRRPLTTSGR